MTMATEKIFIQIGEERIELTGADKEAFLEQRAKDKAEHDARVEAEELAKTQRQAKLDSAITKLKALGLTEAEAKVVIGIE
jgi:hypothetical protein